MSLTSSARVLALGLVLAGAATGASATITAVNAPKTFTNVGDSFTGNFNGFVTNPLNNVSTLVPGLTSSITFKLKSIGNSGKTWTFDLVPISNTSSLPVTASRLSGYGFDVDNLTTVTATGLGFFSQVGTGAFPQTGNVNSDFCFKSGGGGNCSGFGGGGLLKGASLSSTFATPQGFVLNFASSVQSVMLNRFLVRYQSIDAPGLQGASAVGIITGTPRNVVPEPATWAMLIAGFGLVGAAARRRRAVVAA